MRTISQQIRRTTRKVLEEDERRENNPSVHFEDAAESFNKAATAFKLDFLGETPEEEPEDVEALLERDNKVVDHSQLTKTRGAILDSILSSNCKIIGIPSGLYRVGV